MSRRTHHRSALRWFLSLLLSAAFLFSSLFTPQQIAHAQSGEADWLVMIYSDADDNVLEEDMMIDLQEAELVGSTDEVTIVVQSDRYSGGYDGMDDWTSAKRFLITYDDDMERLTSEELEDLGEVNMADGDTLLDFIEWAVGSFPAQKTMLILSDHGSGWPGGWSDPDPGGDGEHDLAIAELFGDSLWLMELDAVLEQARDDLGLEYFDVIGFDACLMSQLEVYTALAPHALYSVASEEVEPGLGWAYAGFLGALVDNPAMEGDELATHIVDTYINDDMRLDDPSYSKDLPRQVVAEVVNTETTLAAVDLSQIASLNLALDTFVGALQRVDQEIVAEARAYAQSYESVFGDEFPSPYIDLGHFIELIVSYTDDPDLLAAAEELEAARAAAVIAERHGEDRPGSTGIAIHFPVLAMYEIADNLGYAEIAGRFAEATQWDEFIAFHMGDGDGESFSRPDSSATSPGTSALADTLQALLPELDAEYIEVLEDEIAAMMDQGLSAEEIADALVSEYELPEEVVATLLEEGWLEVASQGVEPQGLEAVYENNRKPLQIAPILLSAEVAYPDEQVTVETDIEGDRVSYLYSFVGRLLPEEDVLIIEDQDYIFADEDTDVGGVIYPAWPEGGFTAAFDWAPVVYAIGDGTTEIRTLFYPESYGDEPTYSVDGIYHFADGSPDRYVSLYFQNAEMTQVFSFGSDAENDRGAPREITPQAGDQFTVLAQGYNLSEEAEDEYYSAEIGTLEFGDEPFYIVETPAPSGNYVVGILAEDLDGNYVEAYEGLFVVGEEEVTDEGFVPLVYEDLGFALLHPETWAVTDDEGGVVTLMTEDEAGLMTVSVREYPDAADDVEANLTAIEEVLAEVADSDTVENLETLGEPVDYILGSYDAQMVDFSFEMDGVAFAGEVVAATPAPGITYVVYFDALAEEAENLLPDLDAVLYSFDILISGQDRSETGASQPAFGEIFFQDDYSDAESGLYDDAEAQEWGQGFYDLEAEQYVYAMEPASGAIYDYYLDVELPDTFMAEVSSYNAGAVDTLFGLIFQVQDDESFYSFRVSGDGYFLVEKAVGEDLETLVDWTATDAFDTAENVLNTLAVVGYGGAYELYINGVQVGAFSDEEYGAGSVGYFVENFDEEAPADFVFDDLIVGAPAE